MAQRGLRAAVGQRKSPEVCAVVCTGLRRDRSQSRLPGRRGHRRHRRPRPRDRSPRAVIVQERRRKTDHRRAAHRKRRARATRTHHRDRLQAAGRVASPEAGAIADRGRGRSAHGGGIPGAGRRGRRARGAASPRAGRGSHPQAPVVRKPGSDRQPERGRLTLSSQPAGVVASQLEEFCPGARFNFAISSGPPYPAWRKRPAWHRAELPQRWCRACARALGPH